LSSRVALPTPNPNGLLALKKTYARQAFNSFLPEKICLLTGGPDFITCFMAKMAEELIPTRATLIQRLKNWQDDSSWQDFFDTYWGLIYGVAVKRGLTPTEAQDVVQETMISVAKHMPTFRYNPAIGSFKAWLLNMTRWRIADQLRKRKQLGVFQNSSDETGDEIGLDGLSNETCPAELDRLWDDEWEKNLLEVAVAKARRSLDPKQYQIFDFYVNKEWKPERIARTFGISTSQVYLAKHRVTELIKQEAERLKRKMS
jgi:RNA polymerase sigma-70 factor (ECF subfamily)